DVEADPARLETELALIAQKLDVDEELDRLDSHISEIRDVIATHGPVGRRLDFLMQELNREANTLASKSADTETTRAAVDLKVLIEQMREQIQNVE
ncbi:MAG: endoribonuclease YicC domain-containing protein, partial [Woeseia sp.]